jgi:hypothetical protein
LGLSNKAVYEGHEVPPEERHIKDEYPEFYFTPLNLKGTVKCHIYTYVMLSVLYRFTAGSLLPPDFLFYIHIMITC